MVGGGIVAAAVALAWIRHPRALLALAGACLVAFMIGSRIPAVEARVVDVGHRVDQRVQHGVARAMLSHWGFVYTEGWSYKVLDENFYRLDARGNPVSTWIEYQQNFSYPVAVRFALRAAASFVLVPLPWQASSAPALAYLPEQVVWYLLVALAAVGLVAGLRRDPALTLLLVGVSVAGGIGIGMTSGNIGALVRHRGMVIVLLVWISGLGASVLLKEWTAFRHRHAAGRVRGAECL